MNVHVGSLRAHLDLTQEAFGELLGVTRSAVCKWERGARDVPKWAQLSLQRIIAERAPDFKPKRPR